MVVSVVMESAQGWSRQVSIYFCSLRLAVLAPALLRAACCWSLLESACSSPSRAPGPQGRCGGKWIYPDSLGRGCFPFLSFLPLPLQGCPSGEGRVRGVLPETYQGNKTTRQEASRCGWVALLREGRRGSRRTGGLAGVKGHLCSLLPLVTCVCFATTIGTSVDALERKGESWFGGGGLAQAEGGR